ncbi:MAG TPA: 5'-nucleotidase C-terminal domain-containing protein [Polyangia bacterium]|jgi:5'-nucleotidase
MRAISLLGALALVSSAAAVGCGRDQTTPPNGDIGNVEIALQAAPGVTINVVSWTISGPNAFSKAGTIDVSHSATVSTTIGGLPAGSGFAVTLSANSTDGATTCGGGPVSFAVVAGQTTPVSVHLLCHEAPRTGSTVVNGTLNVCPTIDNLSANPSEVIVGASVTLTGSAHDSDAGPSALSYQWTASSGVLANPSAASTSFTCMTPGIATITLSASDGDAAPSCAAISSVSITCTAATCDDGNPCTTDTRAADGTCAHATVANGTLCTDGNLHVKLLGFNDFHGQLDAGKKVGTRNVGSASVLVSYLRAAQAGIEDQTFIVHAGDEVGASPPDSALLQDEPSIQVLNLLANSSCTYTDKLNPACNLVGTLGNHEFDEGRVELLRLLNGGNFATGPFLEDPYRGARFPYVSANVIDQITGQPLIQPLVVKQTHGIPVAFIGAVLKGTPTIVTPTGVAGLNFLDEADAINSYVPVLKAMGVHTIVVTIHQGGFQTSYNGPTNPTATLSSGPEILDIVNRLDDEIDVVISGHTHAFTNALLPNAHGKPILVTQAFSFSTAYDDVDLLIDPVSKDVVSKTASIVTTFADAGPGLTPAADAQAITDAAFARVAPLVTQVFGFASTPFTRTENAAGETTLGDLIADAQLEATGAQLTFMNAGGVRADLDAGDITYNDLFTIQPFGNTMVTMNLTGGQIYQVLEQQFPGAFGQTTQRIMKTSGFHYTWDSTKPAGSKIVEVDIAGVPIDLNATYRISCNNFMATGGDGFATFISGTDQVGGPIDLDVLIQYVKEHTPFTAGALDRVTRL